jgi:hypothetical protein
LYLLGFQQSRIEMDCSTPDHSRRLALFLSAIALLGGGCIYLFLRPGDLVFHRWIRAAGLDWYNPPGLNSTLLVRHFPEWFIYSLPDGMWAFAYALIITVIWSGSRSPLKFFWMASIPLLVLGFEILQATGIVRGTFSMADLAFGLTGVILGIIAGLKTNKKHQHEKSTR